MWHIVVVLWLKGTVVSYALPTVYIGNSKCDEASERLVKHWRSKIPVMYDCREMIIG